MNSDMNKLYKDCETCFFKNTCNQTISKSEFDFLFQDTVQQTFKKGEAIFKQNMQTNYLVYLLNGKVKFNFEDENGKNLILMILKAPSLLGLANILNEDINVFSIIAIDKCKGCLIDKEKLKLLGLTDKMFMLDILKMSTSMFRNSIYNFISLTHKQANGRIADILLYLSKNIYNSNQILLTLTRKELSEFAGFSQEQVIHIIRNLNSDGIIKINGKKIEILNFDRLLKISTTG
jgi:CRP/FNR family transcriptional regulator, polysaccharide utilization system transcription regulator